jgi:hypothetical protein
VLRIRAIGFIMRRDSLRLASLAGHRLEVVLPDAYAFGDIEGMPCTRLSSDIRNCPPDDIRN